MHPRDNALSNESAGEEASVVLHVLRGNPLLDSPHHHRHSNRALLRVRLHYEMLERRISCLPSPFHLLFPMLKHCR